MIKLYMTNMDDLSRNILTELDARHASPKPQWHFVLAHGAFWLLSAMSVAIGGIAMSVGWYVFFDNDGLHVTFASLFRVIPWIWIVVLIVFVVGAYFGFRQTRKGYKYSIGWVLAGILFLSAVMAVVFDHYDFGQTIHKYLLFHTNFYDALIISSEDRD